MLNSSYQYVSYVGNSPITVKNDKIATIVFPQNRDFSFVSHYDDSRSATTENVNANNFQSLMSFSMWGGDSNPVPDFSLITGKNGLGKTQLLEYLNKALVGDHVPSVFFMPADHKLEESTDVQIHDLPIYPGKNYDNFSKKVKKKFSAAQVDDLSYFAQEVCKVIREEKDYNEFIDKLIARKIGECLHRDLNKLKFESPHSFWTMVFNSYAKEFGTNKDDPNAPWFEINKTLDIYGFKYRVHVLHELEGTYEKYHKWQLKKDGDDEGVGFDKLSSGEKLIFSVMSWKFPLDNKSKLGNSVKIMLLDEPDKHLDPQSCELFMDIVKNVLVKNGVQVIMTTHRLDTISLAPEGKIFPDMPGGPTAGIFTIKDNQIQPTTKMLAAARLSKNMRDFTNFHVKVLTESFEDAQFYTEVCRLLLSLESDIKENRYFSRRWQPEFHSVCFDSGLSGGCTIVIPNVIREAAAYENLNKRDGSIIDPKAQKPFGLVDDDWGDTTDKSRNEKAEERITILPRHSLENFTHDPFLLSSVMSFKELNKNIGNTGILSSLIDLKCAVTKTDAQKAATEYFIQVFNLIKESERMKELSKIVGESCIKFKLKPNNGINFPINEIYTKLSLTEMFNYKKEKKDKVPTKISDFVKKYYWLRSDINKFKKKLNKEIMFGVANLIDKELNSPSKKTDYNCSLDDFSISIDLSGLTTNLTGIESRVMPDVIDSKSRIPTDDTEIYIVGLREKIKYPRAFLAARGHDIEDAFMIMENAEDAANFEQFKKFKENFINCLRKIDPKSVYLPEDLLGVFGELSTRIRSQVNGIAKTDDNVRYQKKFADGNWEDRIVKKLDPNTWYTYYSCLP